METKEISLFEHCIKSNESFEEDFINIYKEVANGISKEILVMAFLNNNKDINELKLVA